jgi:hypothetical protein
MQTQWQQQDLLFLPEDLFEAILSKKTIIKICSGWRLTGELGEGE